ncbi:unnamed protein product [Lactuca saligna]|uniref:Ribulose bisphosphate carboxylase/oxygenase activase AAA helical domain-containing protein n=1 Tax=Lactuca saligna TaxID=75948 RepID=A0AA36DXT7_LACSI|nr:unnamed protein product [Lactuca saligna]
MREYTRIQIEIEKDEGEAAVMELCWRRTMADPNDDFRSSSSRCRVLIIVTGNDFSTLYAPLIRDGRMEKLYWAPTREDRIGVCIGIFKTDGLSPEGVTKLVDTFPGQSIDFFGALRARVYDDAVREWIGEQDNVKRVQLAETYLDSAALGDANRDSIARGEFYGELS